MREAAGIAPQAPLLETLRERFASTHVLERVIAEAGIETDFWSRVGD